MHIRAAFSTCWSKIRLYVMAMGLLLTAFILFFWNDLVVSVHSGELGVKYSRFFGGTDLQKSYTEGVYFMLPFDILYIYDIRIIEHSEEIQTLTETGLPVTVHVSCQYQLDPNRLPLLHQQVGPLYKQKVILPMMNTVVRQVIGTYSFDSLYSSARQELEDVMMVKAVSSLGRLPITIHNFIIKNIVLPEEVEKSIIDKMIAKQRYKRYEYLLQEAREEAKRKHIEALGIRNFQEIVNAGMTENFLRYQGIIATRELAESANAKIVVTGGKDGLPVILNTQDTPAPPAAQNPSAPESTPEKQKNTPPSAPQAILPQPPLPDEKTQKIGKDRLDSLIEAIDDVLTQSITPPLMKKFPNP